jgi:hypothetical protein
MDFQLTDDQRAILEPLEKAIADFSDRAAGKTTPYVEDEGFTRALEGQGYFDQDVARSFDATSALLVVEKAATAPLTAPLAGSFFIAPRVSPTPLPGPIAIADEGGRGAIRYLPGAKTLVVEAGGAVRAVDLSRCEIAPIKSNIAYPLGRIVSGDVAAAPALDISPAKFDQLRRLAAAAEMLGLMQGALDLTVGYVKLRKQFKRAIGSFQTVRHRLVECTVAVSGSRYLTYRAAWSDDPAQIELALAHTQTSAARLVYETQQFHGAIGQTLEYPLHLWTFRLRALQGEFRGPSVNAALAAERIWGA